MSSIDWTTVIDTLITTVGVVLIGVYTARIHRGTKFLIDQTRTPSGDSIGKVVERAHETAIANNLLLRKIDNGVNGEEA